MSGHSHYATIKRQKESKDSQKGKVFSRHAKEITIAIKQGGGADPELNSRLRFAIEQAKADNVPKSNIDRILSRANELGNIEEVTYEGYGPCGIAVMIEVATDNKNRTVQEIKNIFERGGGNIASPGSVAFNFEKKGLILVKKTNNPEMQQLALIDLGIDDMEETSDVIEAYVAHNKVGEIGQKIKEAGFEIRSIDLIQKPKSYQAIDDEIQAKKILNFLENLEKHDDVQDVYTNIDIPPDIASKLE